jgi:hypothetical protein
MFIIFYQEYFRLITSNFFNNHSYWAYWETLQDILFVLKIFLEPSITNDIFDNSMNIENDIFYVN